MVTPSPRCGICIVVCLSVSREGCEDFSKETGAALTCLPPTFDRRSHETEKRYRGDVTVRAAVTIIVHVLKLELELEQQW